MAIKYGGKTISDYSAMRGPCPKGFHVPLHTEWESLISAMNSIELSYSDYEQYLLMPYAGMRDAQSNIFEQYEGDYEGASCQYWASDVYISGSIYDVYFFGINSGYGEGVQTMEPTLAFNIRPFKDGAVMPDSTRVRLYNPSATQYGQGIYHNATLGLISIVYRAGETKCITIADKNVGATNTYTKGGTITKSTCGNYFQRGNNYGFPLSGTVSTSGTAVDTTGYGPGNYYLSSTYITGNSTNNYIRFNPRNSDLWGGVTGVKQRIADIIERYYGGKTISDYSAMRGPCPEGFHVPKSSERSAVINTGVSLGARTTSGTTSVTNFRTYLKLPNIVYLFEGNGLPGTGWTPQHRYYWGCRQTGSDGSGRYCDALDVVEDYGGSIRVDNTSSNHGCPVRPFKDKPVAPDNSWTTLYASDVYPASRNIKHSQSLGLITISYDGTYITIADKNAGATSVYNFGDTITSANGGGLYQWGNNYPFSINGATTTSSTRVDTTGYGPGNYYSGSTFITGGANDDWFSPRNRDLWGGVTGIQYHIAKVKEVYYNTTKIWPKYSQIIIESDLTNSTLYSLQNDGWTDIYSSTGTYRLNSNGFAGPEQNNIQAILYKDISEYIDEINEVKNLSLEFDAYGENDTYSGRVECGLRNAVTGSSVYSDIIMGYSSSSSYRYTTINWGPPATTNKTTVNRNGLYHIIFTYNIDTGVVSGNITQSGSSVYSKTYTVSENTRTQIKNNIKILYFSTNRGGNPAGDTTYIKNVKLVVNFN